ncbi:peptidoglycan-binding domain-containing protein, partial [Photobacterium leiognathi]|uniref:peptidoglycan-binding domain-containing protein n=1 Tax=Photobacterium leiognathi TaxID=553611 RepID=UPI002980A49D
MSNKNPKGFHGLSQLVSKIEVDLIPPTDAPRQETPSDLSVSELDLRGQPESQRESSEATGIEPEVGREKQQRDQLKQPEAKPRISWGYLLWPLLIFGIFMSINQNNNTDSNSPVPKVSKSSATTSSTTGSVQTSKMSQIDIPSTIEKINYPLYVKPSVGSNNVLSVSQISWCIRESMRIEAMRNVFDTNGGINEFNKIVEDYNLRCSSYRYRQGHQSKAERQVESARATIVSEAKQDAKQIDQRFKTSSNLSKKVTSNKPDPLLTREVQRLLTELGYTPGPIDGDYGRGTANAIVAFQRDLSIYADGKVDNALIVQLQRETENVSAAQVAQANNQSLVKTSSVLDLSKISSVDRKGIISSCQYNGSPADVYSCQKRELGKLRNSG